MFDRPFETKCIPTRDGLSAFVEGGIPTGCEPYCLVYAPNNATVGNRQQIIEATIGASVFVRCDPGFRLALPGGSFTSEREFRCDYVAQKYRGVTDDEIIGSIGVFHTEVPVISDEFGVKMKDNLCEPFCRAIPKKFTVLATHTE
eukprot:380253_1